MRTVILAGGKGTRLAPYTTVLPKPLMPIGDMPILEVILRQLKRSGCERVTIAVGHLAELLRAFFGDGSKFGIHIDYSSEDKPLGTAGPLSLIDDFSGDFIVMNGDVLTDLDYSALYQYHRDQGAMATIAAYQRNVQIDFGVIEVRDDNTVRDYIEKPKYTYSVSMGVYVFRPEILKYIESGCYLDFPDLVKLLIKENHKVSVYPFSGYWLDIGRPDDYEKATLEFQQLRNVFLPEAGA